MDFKQFLSPIKSLSFGKKLPDALYFFKQDLIDQNLEANTIINAIASKLKVDANYNVIKVFTGAFKLSFLEYADFFEDPHPVLQNSIHVNLSTGKIRTFSYTRSKNPPILHRKEELLNKENHDVSDYIESTKLEESFGLYENTKTIGFKVNWQVLLERKGLSYQANTLIQDLSFKAEPKEESQKIDRHKTAISRFNFSKPVQTLLENNLIDEGTTFFDYGCGLGDDISALCALSFDAVGWDPVHENDNDKRPSDIVNLGFVLNVIESPVERMETLKAAFSYTQKLLVVSCMLDNKNNNYGTAYGDGVLTSRNTFQKYFQQDELRQYIEDVLQVSEAIAAGPGVFYIFKNAQDQQQFLANKSKRQIDWDNIAYKSLFKERKQKVSYLDKYPELLENYFMTLLSLGRPPLKTEFDDYDEVKSKIGSLKKATGLFYKTFGDNALESIRYQRKSDLLVYLALSNFNQKIPLKDLDASTKLDIKTFLGPYNTARTNALSLLFAISDHEMIRELCEESVFGYNDEQALYIRCDDRVDLHPILRIYVGCGQRLYGDLSDFDVIKIHKDSGKLTLLKYNSFEKNILPELSLRIKINLPLRKVRYFDYSNSYNAQILYHKVRFYEDDHPDYKKLKRHSNKLLELGISQEGYGPSKRVFEDILTENRLTENLYAKKNSK